MTAVTIPTLGALVLQWTLGLAVFQANPKRLANQCFLALSLTIGGWLSSLYFGTTTTSPEIAEFWIRQASAASALYLCTLNLLRLSVRQGLHRWRELLGHSRVWLLVTLGIVILCQTQAFLKGAQMSPVVGLPPRPDYGNGVYVFAGFFVIALAVLLISYWRDLRKTSGGEHAELSFILRFRLPSAWHSCWTI
jgi:hypothetical protein